MSTEAKTATRIPVFLAFAGTIREVLHHTLPYS